MSEKIRIDYIPKRNRLLLFYLVKQVSFLWILGMVLVCDASAQTRKTPRELLPHLKYGSRDIKRVDILLQLAEYYVETEWNYSNKIKVDSALPYLREALSIINSLQASEKRYEVLRALGNYYFRCE